jgi:FkbM family methyltransferase
MLQWNRWESLRVDEFMFNRTENGQGLHLFGLFYKRARTILTKILSRQAPGRPHDTEIYSVYQRLLGRQPDPDELLHWKTTGAKVEDMTNALLLSYEYEQKRVNRQRVLVDIKKFKIYAMKSDAEVGRGIIQSQAYEPHVTNILTEILNSGDVFLDLGANIGYFSLLAATIVQVSGKVISFEPNTQNLQLFYASILENKLKNIIVYPFAVSDSARIMKLTSFGSNGFLEIPQSSFANTQFLQSVTVDELLQNEERFDVVKMDIEGYEPLALRGMDKIIKKHKPIILTEFNPWHIKQRTQIEPQAYLKQLARYGYDLYIIEPSGCSTLAPNTDSVMNSWGKLGNDKRHLDLIAQPFGRSA